MPNTFEDEFQKVLRQRQQNKQKRMIQISLAILLLISGILLLISSILKLDYATNIGDFLITPNLLCTGLFGLSLLLSLVFIKIYYLKKVKLQYFLLFLISPLLIFILSKIPQGNYSQNDLMTRLAYNPTPQSSSSPWPWKEYQTIHPVIASMTPEIEKSIKSVAQYIAKNESDPNLQVKAVHDYVVSRVTYDLDVLKTGRRPSQDARTVFRTHKAVCEGYANLFLELGQEVGLDVAYIGGKVRKDLAPLDVIPEAFRLIKPTYDWTRHAWNAVKVGADWQLVDTTWDDSSSADSYNADYLMVPPSVMIMSHLPEQQSWQLLQKPKNLKSFEKQPILTPNFFVEDLKIISPTEYQTNMTETTLIKIQHPLNYTRKIGAFFSPLQESKLWLWNLPSINPFTRQKKSDIKLCQSQNSVETITQVYCQFPEPGDYQVFMFSIDPKSNSPKQSFNPIGQLKFRYY